MDANKLVGQWRGLAERFRRIANNDCSESEVWAAAAHGGRLIYEMKAAGLLPSIELPPREPTERISDDDSPLMLGVWHLVDFWAINPSHVKWENRDCGDAAESLRVGSTDTKHWRIRAENYAAVCDALADEVANHVGRAKLRAFGIAVQLVGQKMAAIDAESEPIIAEHRAEIDRLQADYRDVVERIESEWEAAFGAPYPKEIEDWQRWAARVGWNGERIAEGNWKPRDLFPIIEGYLQRLRDQSGGTGDESQSAGLDRNNIAVLFCLSNREPALQTLDDIVVSAKVSRDTASKALKELIADGLACRPKGERKGATVTGKGRTMAAQIRR